MQNRIENLELIQKEIDIVKSEFDELEASFLLGKKDAKTLEKIEKTKQKSIQKLLVLQNQLNEALDKIDDDRMRIIVRLRIKGWTYEKIGQQVGYTFGYVRDLYNAYIQKITDDEKPQKS